MSTSRTCRVLVCICALLALVVMVDIYDTMGRRVRALVHSDSEPAGPHTAIWDGTDDRGRAVASGVYFYRLDAAPRARCGGWCSFVKTR